MSPASGPVNNPKMIPAATMEDQEEILNEQRALTEIGPAPFSSPDPATDARKMLPLEDGTSSAYDSRVADQARHQAEATNYNSMSLEDLKSLAEEKDLDVEGTGKDGRVKKSDYVDALNSDDTKDMKAADWKEQISAAADQDALDEVAERYSESGHTYKSVEAAVEARQKEIDDADNGNQ